MSFMRRSSEIIIAKLVGAARAWPEISPEYWVQLEAADAEVFGRRALWAACKGSPGPTSTLDFWECVPANFVERSMDLFRQLALQLDIMLKNDMSWAEYEHCYMLCRGGQVAWDDPCN